MQTKSHWINHAHNLLKSGRPEDALSILCDHNDDLMDLKSFHIIRYRIFRRTDRLPDALNEALTFLRKFPSDQFGIKALHAVSDSISKLNIREQHRYYRNKGIDFYANNLPLLLNIGAGDTYFENFIGLDFDSEHYGRVSDKSQISYDARTEKIPFGDGTVDGIYVSHVLEHLEDDHVELFFKEASRVLKPQSVLRINVPDARLMFDNTFNGSEFWNFRLPWFKAREINISKLEPLDFLMREICTPRLCVDETPNNIRYDDRFNVKEILKQTDNYREFMNTLVRNASFDELYPSNHINYFDIEKIKQFANKNFSRVLRSTPGGSVSSHFQSVQLDKAGVKFSLFLDLVK